MACNNVIQKSLEWCQGTPVYPGIKRRVYYISKQYIVGWPTLKTTAGDRAEYEGDFTLAADAAWKYIDVIPEKCTVTSEAQGEIPSQTQLNKLSVVHPGTGKDASDIAFSLNNSDNVFLVEDMNGKYRVIGSERWNTVTTVAQDLGQGATGSASTTINAEATDVCPAPFYSGEITTEAGKL